MRLLSSLILGLVLTIPLFAQCSGGSCRAPQVAGPAAPVVGPAAKSAKLQWVAGNGEIYLYRGGVQIGGYQFSSAIYRDYDAKTGQWSSPCFPPPGAPALPPGSPFIPTSVSPALPPGADANYGVSWQSGPEPKYTANGKEIDKETARKLVGGTLTDDSGKLWVTVIGDDAARSEPVKALKTLPADLAGVFAVKEYKPDRWEVAQSGFVTTGSPTIYCQAPSGKVLHRQDDAKDGPEALFTALRKAKASYDKTKDPDLRKTALSPATDFVAAYWPLGAILAGVVSIVGLANVKQRKV